MDPRSSDFGKIQIGPTRIDFWGGYQQIARYGTQISLGLAGEFNAVGSNGVEYKVNPLELVGRYLRGKLAPSAGYGANLLADEDMIGNEFNPTSWETISGMVLPLWIQDMTEAFQVEGAKGLLYTPLATMGVAVQTYKTKGDVQNEQTERLYPGKTYRDLLPSERDAVDQTPEVQEITNPSEIREASLKTREAFDAEQTQAEDAHERGDLSKPLPEIWHDIGLKRVGARQQLQADFEAQLGGTKPGRISQIVDGYYAIEEKFPDGQLDFEKTEARREEYLNTRSTSPKGSEPSDAAILRDYIEFAEGKKSQKRQEYNAYIEQRESLGYFADGLTQADRAELDKANPELDVQSWYWQGGVSSEIAPDAKTPSLNSSAAVDQAIAMQLPNRPIKLAGLARPVNQDELSLAAWAKSRKGVDAYQNKVVDAFGNQEAQRLYKKPYAQLTEAQQASVAAVVKTNVRQQTPEMDAWLMWWGVTDTLQSRAAAGVLAELTKTYGKKPPKADWQPRLAQDAR
jgi:hypothetical protein